MTRAKALLLSLAVFVLGGAGYWGFWQLALKTLMPA